MHYEILVEGQCENTFLSIFIKNIIGPYLEPHTWKIHKHRGVGQIPENPQDPPNARDPSLLNQLPAKLRGYSKVEDDNRVVIVLLDLDDRNRSEMLDQLEGVVSLCERPFKYEFLFAVEELEAWYLGDKQALKAYEPKVDDAVLSSYIQDSICGTWELLARADPNADGALVKRSRRSLDVKRNWAKKITPHMKESNNVSMSFGVFCDAFKKHMN